MEQGNCTTFGRRKYKHLSEKERFKIEGLLDGGKSVSEIAVLLGRNCSTIHREVRRGTVERLKNSGSWVKRVKKYRANVAQADYSRKCTNRERSLKIGKDRLLEEHIRVRITRDRYSPDAIVGEIKSRGLRFTATICTKTLYNYIDMGIFSGIDQRYLWYKSKKKKRKYKVVVRTSSKNRFSRSIEDRSKEVNNRLEYGHWEGDTVKGPRRAKAGLITLTERKTREQLILKVDQLTQGAVKAAFDRLERRYGAQFKVKFKSITLDNGSEFLNWESLEASILEVGKKRTVIYFAHAYSSWERGTNENHNGMIRRFIFKGLDIAGFDEKEIKTIEDWMNNYPRRILGYNTPSQAAKDCLDGNSDRELSIVAI